MTILNNRGQGLTEYLVLLILISVISIGAVTTLGKTIQGKLKEAKDQINKVSAYEK